MNAQPEYQTEYELFRWRMPEELASEMERRWNIGWREHLTALHGEPNESGWTIFYKTAKVEDK